MKYLLLIPILCLTSCATRPHIYKPPDPGKLKASTQRVATAVNSAHQHARQAQYKVGEATEIAKVVQKETAALKDVPVTLVAKVIELEGKLDETRQAQTSLEKDLLEADAAKAQVEKDKAEYFTAAQKLADDASKREVKAAAAINRYHSLKLWLCLAIAGAVGLIVFQFKAVFLLLGPYGWGAMAALPMGAFAICWMIF